MADEVRPAVTAAMRALAASLGEPQGSSASSADTTYRKISTLIRAAGSKAISPKLRSELAAAAAAARLHTDWPLDDPSLTPDRRVRFSRAPFSDAGLLAPSEQSLRNWVIGYIGRQGPFSRCYDPQIEYRIPGQKRFIDLLLKERGAAGRWVGLVAVEFELTSPAGTVGQLLGYLDQLSRTEVADGKQLRGVIVSGDAYPPELQHLEKPQPWPIDWFVVDARLKPAGASPR